MSTWLNIAVIDPTGREKNNVARRFCANTIDPTGVVVSHRIYTAPPGSYKVIPLSEMYAFPLTAADQARIDWLRADYVSKQAALLAHKYGRRIFAQDRGCPAPKVVNPAYAFVGMHVVSAELNDVWTWQTFWWQPNVRPIPGAVGPFAHFDHATAYWTVNKPPYGFRFAFNPYLESDFGTATFASTAWPPQGQPGSVPNLGRTTDCISCHQVATYTVDPAFSPSPSYVAHGSEPQPPPFPTKSSILTRNLWSLAIRAGHPK
ncbi:MAG: hypothetical protein JO199_14020 [Candidatus Eremiobacteraeota bacterium]|nr:hypothetical protein [Candidatus Eremiobacteraeota bacterium]